MITYDEILLAFDHCLKNKKKSFNAINFTIDSETKLLQLIEEINNREYDIGKSIAFVVKYPKYREVFAAEFRDRIVHHLVIDNINDILEKSFIENSFSCRVGKGTLFGIQQIQKMIKDCINKYDDCYILKLDIDSFFMSIDRALLKSLLFDFIEEKYIKSNKDDILYLIEKILMHRPEKNCTIKCDKELWNFLPKSKSLFYVGEKYGLPIGNLTSQVFANFYLNFLDHYITDDLNFEYYGRYVDDFIILCHDKNKLLKSINLIEKFLKDKLHLKLHKKKRYIQHYTKGVSFIGNFIYINRLYIINRTKGQLFFKLKKFYNYPINKENIEKLNAIINSYLGFMRYVQSYKIRKSLFEDNIYLKKWNKYFKHDDNYTKIIIDKEAIKKDEKYL